MTEHMDDAMRTTIDEITNLVGLEGHGRYRADVEIVLGSIAVIRIVPADPSQPKATSIMDGPYTCGLRAMNRAQVHVMEERHDPDTDGYVFFVMKGRGYLGRVSRIVAHGAVDMVVLKRIDDAHYGIECEPSDKDIHEVPRDETHGGRIRRMMTCVGDRVRIIHPHDPRSPIVLLNDSTNDLRMMSEV